MTRLEIQNYINENLANIKSIQFYATFAYINMLDGTTINLIATDEGSLEVDKY